jgi:hypothetical protein
VRANGDSVGGEEGRRGRGRAIYPQPNKPTGGGDVERMFDRPGLTLPRVIEIGLFHNHVYYLTYVVCLVRCTSERKTRALRRNVSPQLAVGKPNPGGTPLHR